MSQNPTSSSTQFAQISVRRASLFGDGGSAASRDSRVTIWNEVVSDKWDIQIAQVPLTYSSMYRILEFLSRIILYPPAIAHC
jgi:hypothetical protein